MSIEPTTTTRNGFPWNRVIPDFRGWVAIGFFALAWRVLYMIEGHSDLLKDAAFISLATIVLGGSGIGAIAAYAFGSAKDSATKNETINALANKVDGGTT